VVEAFVTFKLVPVALVKVARWREESPVAVKVATWRFPLPVAFVKVIPVEETTPRKVVAVTLPEESTLNWVLEFTWRSMKLPLKPAAMFAPR
jgi:hypothetical protein